MTTLIIHPKTEAQKEKAFSLALKLLKAKTADATVEAESEKKDHPDLHILDGTRIESKNIGIDDVRGLTARLQFEPYQAPIQVGLIILANLLTTEAQNALLKSLEEPGTKTQFILTAPNEKTLLPTIISRSSIIYLDDAIEGDETDTEEEIQKINNFLKKDLVTKFLKIEKIIEKDKKDRGYALTFLRKILSAYRTKLLEQISRGDRDSTKTTAADIEKITRSIHFINRNANKRITLENLILQLEK